MPAHGATGCGVRSAAGRRGDWSGPHRSRSSSSPRWSRAWPCGCTTAPAQSAWESVYYLQYHVQGGWLLRAVHHYSAQVMLVLVGVWLVEMIFRGAYRAPREAIFWTVVLMGLVTLALNLTGDLLPWDQNGYWSTRVRTGFLLLLPGVGRRLFELAAGGADFGHLTLTRFVALHVGVFSGAFGLLLWAARPADAATLRWNAVRKNRRQRRTRRTRRVAYWPRQALRDAAGVRGGPGRGAGAFAATRPVAGASRGGAGAAGRSGAGVRGRPAGMVVPRPVPTPRVVSDQPGDRAHLRDSRARGAGAVGDALDRAEPHRAWVQRGDWSSCWPRDWPFSRGGRWPPTRADKDYQAALAAADWRAGEIKELIAPEPDGPPRIPPGGALALQRRRFAGCTLVPRVDGRPRRRLRGPRAWPRRPPHLYRFASREWLDRFPRSEADFRPEVFRQHEIQKRGDAVVRQEDACQARRPGERGPEESDCGPFGRGGLPSQRDMDARDAEKIKLGRAAFGTFGCTDCHKFRGQGKLRRRPRLDRLWFSVLAGGDDPQSGRAAVLWVEERPDAGLRRDGRAGRQSFERRGHWASWPTGCGGNRQGSSVAKPAGRIRAVLLQERMDGRQD